MAALRSLDAEIAGWEQQVEQIARKGVRSNSDKRMLERAQDNLRRALARRRDAQ